MDDGVFLWRHRQACAITKTNEQHSVHFLFESKFPYDLFKLQMFMIKLERSKNT